MNKETIIKTIIFIIGFLFIFLLIYPEKIGCYNSGCFEVSLMFSFLFAWQKLNEYDFLKGNAFYGVYTYGIKIPSLQENSSDENKLRRLLWFLSLISFDIMIFYAVYKLSWIFN
ncbi:hypothetical protein [bacterium endosymbiont of Bathymodiolus sp. 5 South]|jgi:predicted membrane protein|uniref:hypothetical protein n=1 Tax=bacterium endosymbiont of Bathymodiolus sp. 5 South TaxID=1181670 RepID=UPI0010B21FC0|nr:hypothetical protein [bacterium endosymbiont of Bathymodiolus sp. 5 South]SHN94044.1 hypothetical protein BCLUESOX_1516 [bacterium endosymbiont of Bathymodiolus sp. 5 South]VVH54958.1 hypothetical protein BSPCLSOX_1727 [uncultured Gammaproteobacteria bacterium]VVH65484.1 hypothetical protein BSPLISOX_1837 [uncultured Gammaproteobacteria bacterium]VVM17566.1 hypothetical protein BSPWISOXPB_3572 [uncultured Gammaproteobacteria bacterium]